MSLHSAYNPKREADRYVDAQRFPCRPLFIVVTEPGESYLASAFRAKYPDACLVAIRYTTDDFITSDAFWDRVWRPGNGRTLYSFLFDLIGDEYLPLAAFVRWKPSDDAWPDAANSAWGEIARLYAVQKAVMHTRSVFGRRWLANTFRNALFAEQAVDMTAPERPVFLALAGPSLEAQFPFDADDFFMCAVSSALSCLAARGYEPDLCFATDGGNWARALFDAIRPDVPVAFPLEAAIPARVLGENPSVLLDYGSALERDILSIMGTPGKKAERNGTVAGTAAMFFIEHTNATIYAAGLDLCGSTSYSHARPHPSLDRLEASSGRFDALCGELYARGSNSPSLDAYASWFSSRDDAFKSRFFRLGPVRRIIDGIGTVNLRDVGQNETRCVGRGTVVRGTIGRGGVDSGDAAITLQRMSDRHDRVDALRSYLLRFRDIADRCLGTENPEEKAALFGRELDVSANGEMLRMVSYTGYVNCLKATRDADERNAVRGLADAIDRLCADVRAVADELARKTGTTGKAGTL